MTRYRHAAYALAAGMLLVSAGCRFVKTPVVAFSDDGDYLQREVGRGLVADPNPLIPDVPMPVGFKALNESNWRYDGRVRVVNHIYQGHAKPGDAVAFYQRTLPGHDWLMVDMQGVGESTILRYTKGPEQLSVSAEDSWGVATITIEMQGR